MWHHFWCSFCSKNNLCGLLSKRTTEFTHMSAQRHPAVVIQRLVPGPMPPTCMPTRNMPPSSTSKRHSTLPRILAHAINHDISTRAANLVKRLESSVSLRSSTVAAAPACATSTRCASPPCAAIFALRALPDWPDADAQRRRSTQLSHAIFRERLRATPGRPHQRLTPHVLPRGIAYGGAINPTCQWSSKARAWKKTCHPRSRS